MVKQLAYSGTLEVTQIRKAGLNVRKPLKHFFQYYKVCADEPAALRAGTDGEPARAGGAAGGGGGDDGGVRPARAGRPSERAGDRPHRLRAGKILWCALGCDRRYFI